MSQCKQTHVCRSSGEKAGRPFPCVCESVTKGESRNVVNALKGCSSYHLHCLCPFPYVHNTNVTPACTNAMLNSYFFVYAITELIYLTNM